MIIATEKRKGRDFQNDLDKLREWEDFTTSSIIGTLLLLPTEQVWNIFAKAANSSKKNSSLLNQFVPTEILEYKFWPSWRLDKNRVEPDAFIRFKGKDGELCLIIEAKRKGNYNLQNEGQHEKELESFPYPYDKKLLLAIGGNTNKQKKDVIQFSWESLLQAVKEEKESRGQKIEGTHVERIYNQLLTAFKVHQIQLYKFIENIPNIQVDASGINAFIKLKNDLKKRN